LPSLVNKRRKQLFAVVLQRQTLADSLARHLGQLGLQRRQRQVPGLREYLASRSNGAEPREIVHRYRKTHPWCPPVGGEDICFGREFPVTDIPGVGKIGTMICYDAYFPEVARPLAFNGAEIILWNSMGFHPWKDIAVATAITRAVENSCYVVLSAGSGVHVGIGLHGNSMIVDPHGVVIMRVGDSPTIAMDVIDADNVTVARTEGGKGVLLPWQHLAQFGNDYPYQQSRKLAAEEGTYKRPKSA